MALEQSPGTRTDEQVDALVKEMSRLSSFAFLPHRAQEAFCRGLLFREYYEQESVIITHEDISDAWWIVLSGVVAVVPKQTPVIEQHIRFIHEGFSFGVDSDIPGLIFNFVYFLFFVFVVVYRLVGFCYRLL